MPVWLQILLALVPAVGVVIILADKLFGSGRKSGKTDAAIADLAAQILALDGKADGLDLKVERFATAIAAQAEMCVRLTIRQDEGFRRLEMVEGIGVQFTGHAAKDTAEHNEMMRSIERLTGSSNSLQAQIARIIPADLFAELGSKTRPVPRDAA